MALNRNFNPYYTCFVAFLVLMGHFVAYGQRDLLSKNFNHLYDVESEFFLHYKAFELAGTDSIKLSCQLMIQQERASINDYNFSFFSTDSYGASLETRLTADSAYIGRRGKGHFLEFKLPAITNTQLLVIEVLSKFSGTKYNYDMLSAEILPLEVVDRSDVPVVDNWVRPGEYRVNADQPVYGLYYTLGFDPSLPPMVTRDPNPPWQISIDSMLTVTPSEPFVLDQEGLYLFQKDTSLTTGTPIRMVDRYYPKPARLEQLVDPLIYITTKDEWSRLSSKSIEKKDFDKFWLDLTRSESRAKRIIKVYYDRVNEANQLFTTYKNGWKTDKGMIYIVFGMPDRVTRTQDNEKWSYFAKQNAPPIEFEFIRINSIFSSRHYVLIREKKFANPWFRAIDMLRKGRF